MEEEEEERDGGGGGREGGVEEKMNRVGQLESRQSWSTGRRISGQRHTAHCSTAPAGSQRLLPESQEPPKLPSWGRQPGVRLQHSSISPFGQSNNSQVPF